MDSMPPLETVYQAIHTLYNDDPNRGEKEKADLWLRELQKSVWAWKISDEMLQQKKDMQSCFFAAQTMRSKIQHCFQELPAESHISLRDSLLNHISQINKNTNTRIVTQLSAALADLILQMATWEHPIRDLFEKFGNDPEYQWTLLEILTVLPEEMDPRYLRLGENRRKEIIKHFEFYCDIVLQYLIECPKKDQDVLTYSKILRCCTTWLEIKAISVTAPLFPHIITLVFEILQNNGTGSDLHKDAADCMIKTLQILATDTLLKRDVNTGDPILPLQHLQLELFNKIVNLEQSYHMSVAHEDMNKSINYCHIFTTLSDTFLETIINGSLNGRQHYAIKALDFALMCVGHYDYEVAHITFELWYNLSEIIYQRENDELSIVFKPYIERLISSLCRHCQMEPDYLGLLEEGEGFAEFRRAVDELIRDVVFIVGSSHCFRQMFNTLTAGAQGEPAWEVTEAALFIMKAVAKNILPEENDVVPKVVEAILNLPDNTHIAVKHTSILLLGELCEWVQVHPQTLEAILNFLLNCLTQKGLAGAASNALQSICTMCSNHMVSHFPGLLLIAKSINTFEISNRAATSILQGVLNILSRLPNSVVAQYVKELCWCHSKPLNELIECRMVVEKDTKTDPVIWLDRLAVIFRNANPILEENVHPCTEAAGEMWPVLSNTLAFYQHDIRIMERCCRCIRFMIRCLGQHSAFLLDTLVKQIIELYTIHHHSCYLYLGSILVDEFGLDVNYVSGLLGMLEAFIGPAFTLLQQTDGLVNHPDTVDDLFRLCTRFLQTSPVPFLRAPMINDILDCALLACSIHHKEANASVMKFFFDLIRCVTCCENGSDLTVRRQLIENILREKGPALVTTLINSAVFHLPYYTLSDISNIILELRLISEEFQSWVHQAINQMPTKNAGGSETYKPEQLMEFYTTITTAESSNAVKRSLLNFIRLYN
ncbi:transportin-3 isoform X1 [Copidosoma floridanum]|uniref:transportin-3 isoform X1 n=1 Tax=Copidosoma floridanum TaxID=29053 RepID=UPI0006C93F08|nr:transportin-3 isoform X1 [Copidosoma floridanum]